MDIEMHWDPLWKDLQVESLKGVELTKAQTK